MAPKEGNSIVKHGVLDDRLNVHGVQGLKVADLSICPDNVGCNTYSTALLIGEKCSVLAAEDLGYSGSALDMRVPGKQQVLVKSLPGERWLTLSRLPGTEGDDWSRSLVGKDCCWGGGWKGRRRRHGATCLLPQK